jgi:hypothetical protein
MGDARVFQAELSGDEQSQQHGRERVFSSRQRTF